MINAILLHLIGGQAWYTCGGAFLLVAGLDAAGTFDARPLLRRAAGFLLVLLLPLAALTGTPLPLPLAVPLVAAAAGYAFYGFGHPVLRVRWGMAATAGALVAAALAAEWLSAPPWRPTPAGGRTVFILADSLTAGGYGESRTWPKLLADRGLRIRDLSEDASTTRSMRRRQLKTVLREADPAGSLVFIELGGNDMFGELTADEYAEHLDALLADLRGRGLDVGMMELPVIPGRWRFGAIQRDAAARHGVALIPKRVLAGILLTDGNTAPGDLHLSQAGHEAFAARVAEWLGE